MIRWFKQRKFERNIVEGNLLIGDAIKKFPHPDIAAEELFKRALQCATTHQKYNFRDNLTDYLFHLERDK